MVSKMDLWWSTRALVPTFMFSDRVNWNARRPLERSFCSENSDFWFLTSAWVSWPNIIMYIIYRRTASQAVTESTPMMLHAPFFFNQLSLP